MTTYSGNIAYSADNPAFGDGDEADFDVLLSGALALSLTTDSSGDVTGGAALVGDVSGSTPDDADGDTDAFDDDISASTTVSGTLSGGVDVEFVSNNGSAEFQGTFSDANKLLSGTLTVYDDNLGQAISTEASLFTSDGGPGLTETSIPVITPNAQFASSTGSSGNWTAQSQPIDYDPTAGSWTLASYNGVIDGVNFIAADAKYYAGQGIEALDDAVSDEASEAIISQVEEESPTLAANLSSANEALTLYQTLKTFVDDEMNLIQRGANSIAGTDDITPEEFDQQATEIANNLETNLVSQLTGIPSSALNVIQKFTGKIVNLFSDASPVFEVYEGTGTLGGNSALTYGMIGGSGGGTLEGGGNGSVLAAGSGAYDLVPGSGDEWLIGGAGDDQAIFSGDKSAYTVTRNTDGTVTVSGTSGTDTLYDVRQAVFADQTVYTGLPVPAGFSDNGISDIPLQNTDGQMFLLQEAGSGGNVGNYGSAWQLVGADTFYTDGNTDIVLQNTDGQIFLFDMQGNTVSGYGNVGNYGQDWKVVGSGNFFSDGDKGLVLQNTDGQIFLFDMQGSTVAGYANVGNYGSDWQVAATGDFFGDGNTDLVLQETSGDIYLLDINNGNVVDSGNVGNFGAGWRVAGAGSFFSDGSTDLVLQNTDGQIELADMQGSTVVTFDDVGNFGSAWQVKEVGSFFGDGQEGLALQNTSGQIYLMELSGGSITQSANLGNFGSSWHIPLLPG